MYSGTSDPKKQSNSDKLNQLLGFDATKSQPDAGALAIALAKIQQERADKLAADTEKILREGIDISNKMADARQKFEKEYGKMDEGLGKIIKRIESLAKGRPPEPEKPAEGGDVQNVGDPPAEGAVEKP
jgi:hypothetical protein